MDEDKGRPAQTLDSESKSIRVAIIVPEGYRFIPDRQHYLVVRSSNEEVLEVSQITIDDLDFDWEVPVEVLGEGETTLEMSGLVFFCPLTDGKVCIYGHIEDRLTVRVGAGSGGEVEFVHKLEDMHELHGGWTAKGQTDVERNVECNTTH